MRTLLAAPVLALLTALTAQAADAPYAGQQGRAIASFSAADIAAIEAGEGWGLALPAELNGWPGPAHVIELADALSLDATQRSEIEAILDAMRRDARKAGRRMLDAEAALDAAFASGEIDTERLGTLLAAAASARAELRAVHLGAHLATTPLLSRHQRMLYGQARGYGDGHDGHADHGGSH